MSRILVTYNVCGISRDNTNQYPYYLKAICDQEFDGDIEIIVQACKPRPHTIPILKNQFPKCHFLEIKDSLPINITFNKALLEGVKRFGKFDTYAYMTCDAFCTSKDVCQGLHDILQANADYGMVSAQISDDQDSCYAYGLGLGRHHGDDAGARKTMFAETDEYVVPVGKACAAHANFYSSKIFDYYGRCCPDIFAGYCTESTWSFVAAALKLKWVIAKNFEIHHGRSMDVPSSGFRPEARKPPPYDHPFGMETLLPIFESEYARSIGLGYEECQKIVVHDATQFDENGYCINDKLAPYIRDNLYLSKELFDYDGIDCEFLERA